MKSSELTGIALDWAVAKCEGLPLKLDPMGFFKHDPKAPQSGYWIWDGEGQSQIIGHRKTRHNDEEGYSPSKNWAQGGAIIEREYIGLWSEGYDWEAKIQTGSGEWLTEWHETPLIAAMRAYVASKLGDEIDVPDSLKTQPAGE